jgi:hypothetical protein
MSDIQNNLLPEDQFSFKDIIIKIVNFKNLIVKNWKLILILMAIGSAMGYAVEIYNKEKPVYLAKIIFNMENGSGGGGGGLSDIASALGFGGGAAPSAGLFSGDNFVELLKTKNIYNRAILSKIKIKGKDVIFGNYYLKKSGILDDELEDDIALKTFEFKHDKYENCTLKEKRRVRLVQQMLMPVTMFGSEGKKTSFMSLAVITRNDTLSYHWANLYLKIVTDFYKETKTQKTRELQLLIKNRVDSLKRELYRTQGAAARYADQNQQIIVQEGLVQQQRLQANSGQLQTLYFEAVRQLDNLNFSIAKETPLFTRIDEPELPIYHEKDPTEKGYIFGAVLGLIVAVLFISIKKIIKEIKIN